MERKTIDGLPVYEVVLDDNNETGIDMIAFTVNPAIQFKGLAFSEHETLWFANNIKKETFESYTDYPKAASENAKVALRWVEENGWGDCGTPVGKARANQLANGEAISEETISRMAAFERHRQNSQKDLGDGCGRLMWLCWGGDAGVEWASRKLKQIREEKLSEIEFSEHKNLWFSDNLKKRITAPAMIPKTIYRNDGVEEYYVEFTKETIEKLHARFMESIAKGNASVAFNIEHNQNDPVPAYVLEAWIVEDSLVDKSYAKFGISVPVGTLMITAQITDDTYYNNIVKNDQIGFSIEGLFGLYSINKINEIQMEEMKLPNGEYLVDGKTYVVENGVVTEIKEEVAEELAVDGKCSCNKYDEPKEEVAFAKEEPTEEKMQEVLDETAIAAITEAIVNEKLTEVYDVIAQLKADILAIQGEHKEIVTEESVELSAHQRFADVQKNFIKRKY